MKTPNLEKLIERVEHELENFDTAVLVTNEARVLTQALRKATEALENHHKHWNMPDDKCSGECSDTCRTLAEIEALAERELK